MQDEYKRRYGARLEAKFRVAASIGAHEAKQRFRDWETEVATHIKTIRAERTGEGIALTPQQARALAGEWYGWFVAKHPVSDLRKWEDVRDRVQEALKEAVGDDVWERNDPDDLWHHDEGLRKSVRPVLADVGETAQFLAMKQLTLNYEAHNRFLDWMYDDVAAALKRLMRIARGDYEDDGYAKRFPKFVGADKGETPKQLFEAWVSERKPAKGSVDTWRYFFDAMTSDFSGRSGGSITPDEAQAWIKGLVTAERSARTVANNWMRACKAVFGWAAEHKRIPQNPFATVKLTVPRTINLRETKAFRPDERNTILRAATAITNTDTPDMAARRWVPWLCAYTGARPGEITQLRGVDVIEQDGVAALRITPDAGSVKGGKARLVPLHADLIEQGFLKFAAEHGEGPLFYQQSKKADAGKRKHRAVQARQRLAAWVRGLGVTDPELSPIHAWRHTFKQIADRAGISERMSDYITGHAHRSIGAGYGAPTLEDMAEALKKFPRYDV